MKNTTIFTYLAFKTNSSVEMKSGFFAERYNTRNSLSCEMNYDYMYRKWIFIPTDNAVLMLRMKNSYLS